MTEAKEIIKIKHKQIKFKAFINNSVLNGSFHEITPRTRQVFSKNIYLILKF